MSRSTRGRGGGRPGRPPGLRRSETAKAIYGAHRSTAVRSRSPGRRSRSVRPAPRSRRASRSSPRTARPRASSRPCPCATTSCWPPCRAVARRLRLGPPAGRGRRAAHERLRIKASSPDQKVGELSGGNQQKVLLARVLCLTHGSSSSTIRRAASTSAPRPRSRRSISELAGSGIAVLLISSELEEVVEGSDTHRRAARRRRRGRARGRRGEPGRGHGTSSPRRHAKPARSDGVDRPPIRRDGPIGTR